MRGLREEARLSIRTVALRGGIHESYLAKLEKGGHEPTWAMLRKVATGLGVSLARLVREIDRLESEQS